MDSFDALVGRLAKIERGARIALACQSAVRVEPVYDACWGHREPAYAAAVELAWRHVAGDDPDPAASIDALTGRLDYYYDEDEEPYALMAQVVTVALRAVEALDADAAASALAVARALYTAIDVAGGAEAETRAPWINEPEEAEAEEQAWQEAAIRIAETGPAARDMFDALPSSPQWLRARLAKGLWQGDAPPEG